MQLYTLLLAITGVAFMVFLAANILSDTPRLKKLEPLFVGLSLGIVFWALLTSSTGKSEPFSESIAHANLSKLQWASSCPARAGGPLTQQGNFQCCPAKEPNSVACLHR